ncbi:MAG: co-chaperone GroES [Candidatus Electryoneaceae bacterium]|nr:co-chaperone GroES [Candidatus Electryoneaceae bacterium]
MNIQPIDDRALIKPNEEEDERKVGSLYIPATASKERPQIGEVIAVGNEEISEVVAVGDKVVFAKYGGTEIKVDDEEYLIVSRADILAVVKD